MQYRVCPECGAHLDPCEVCDCSSVAKTKAPITVTGIIDSVCSEICDDYCKFPEQYDCEDSDAAFGKLLQEHCNDCPRNRL